MKIATALLLLASLALGCGQGTAPPSVSGARLPVHPILVGNERITAEIAATEGDRAEGLMRRESMPESHGMLFIYPEVRILTFWMRNTPLPLSIAFADDGGRIVQIADMEPFSESIVSSGAPARYALEMHQGWFARHGVLPGDAIRGLPRLAPE